MQALHEAESARDPKQRMHLLLLAADLQVRAEHAALRLNSRSGP